MFVVQDGSVTRIALQTHDNGGLNVLSSDRATAVDIVSVFETSDVERYGEDR